MLSWGQKPMQEREKNLCLAVPITTEHFITNKRDLKIWNRSSLFETPCDPWNPKFGLCSSKK